MPRTRKNLSLDQPKRDGGPRLKDFLPQPQVAAVEAPTARLVVSGEFCDAIGGKFPSWLVKEWEHVPSLAPSAKVLQFLRRASEDVSTDDELVAFWTFVLGRKPEADDGLGTVVEHARAPRGLFARVVGPPVSNEDHRRNILSVVVNRQRKRLLANLLLIALKGDDASALRFFERYFTRSWRGGPAGVLLSARPRLEALGGPGFALLRDRLPGLHDLANRRRANEHARPAVDEQTVVRFIVRYRLGQLEALYNPSKTVERVRAGELVAGHASSLDAPAFWELRRGVRMTHLIPDDHFRQEWVKELIGYAAAPETPSAIAFAAYCGLYFLDRLDTVGFASILEAQTIDAAWSEEALHAVVAEAQENLKEDWYKTNPYHKAANLLRVVVYVKVSPRAGVMRRGDLEVVRRLAVNALGVTGISEEREVRAEARWLREWALQLSHGDHQP